jgi:hypothetical protein
MGKEKNVERYNVTLDPEVVKKAKEQLDYTGGQLSPIINKLLKVWINYQEDMNKLFDKLKGGKKS